MFSIFVSEILALVLVFATGYYMLLDSDIGMWWRKKVARWISFGYDRSPVGGQNVLYGMLVGGPALVYGVLDGLIDSRMVHFSLAVLALLVGLRVTSCIRYQVAICKAVYANDSQLAIKLANSWEGREDGLEDSVERFVPRMLSLCATRLSEDVFASLIWYVLLGPAGIILVTMNSVFFNMKWAKPVRLNLVEWVSDLFSSLMFAVSGNMGRGLQVIFRRRPAQVALAAGNIDVDQLDLESVPLFGKMLTRALFIGTGMTLLLLA